MIGRKLILQQCTYWQWSMLKKNKIHILRVPTRSSYLLGRGSPPRRSLLALLRFYFGWSDFVRLTRDGNDIAFIYVSSSIYRHIGGIMSYTLVMTYGSQYKCTFLCPPPHSKYTKNVRPLSSMLLAWIFERLFTYLICTFLDYALIISPAPHRYF